MRLGDLDALDKMIYEQIPIKVFGTVKRMAAMREIIQNAPTVDAVPVVRCKDCCWYVEDEECDPFCGHKDIYIRPDYFCADGEKVSK